MLDEKQLERLKPLFELYSQIEIELLERLTNSFLMNQEFINSDVYRIQKLNDLGVFYNDIVSYINNRTKVARNILKTSLDNVLNDTIDIDRLSKAYKDGKIKVNPNYLLQDNAIKTILNEQYILASNDLILLSEGIKRSVRQEYLNILNKSLLETEIGAISYGESIKNALNDLARKGISVVEYRTINETGEVIGSRNYSIEGLVRRDILTNTRDLSNKLNMQLVNQLECEYIKISEHLDCRPQHFDWQGTIIKRTELVPITGYGEVDGLGGINCKHYFSPYFGDKVGNEEKEYTQKECDKKYKLSQKQRYLERQIRAYKRKEIVDKQIATNEPSIENNITLSNTRKKEKYYIDKYHRFCNKHNLNIDYTRIYV